MTGTIRSNATKLLSELMQACNQTTVVEYDRRLRSKNRKPVRVWTIDPEGVVSSRGWTDEWTQLSFCVDEAANIIEFVGMNGPDAGCSVGNVHDGEGRFMGGWF